MRFLLSLVAALLAAFAFPSQAELTRLEITSQRPFGSFRSGDYVLMEGKVQGEIAPTEAIPGLDKASRNARGRVEYSARIVLIIPAKPSQGNGTLIVDIPNRGKAYAQAIYNSPRDEAFQSGTFEQGTGFLQDRGFSVAAVYWELGQGAELPSFTEDGKKLYVEGAGFPIVRDTTDFLRNDKSMRTAARRRRARDRQRQVAERPLPQDVPLQRLQQDRRQDDLDGLHVFTSAGMLPPCARALARIERERHPTFDDVEWRGYTEEPLTMAKVAPAARACSAELDYRLLLDPFAAAAHRRVGHGGACAARERAHADMAGARTRSRPTRSAR
jgi:hypothetical protein